MNAEGMPADGDARIETSSDVEVRDWVRDRRVYWEVLPLMERARGSNLRVGFELVLGAQNPRRTPCTPACTRCTELFDGLRAVAAAILPRDLPEIRCDIQPFDAALHLRPDTGWTPEVQLVIHISHREGYLRTVDEGLTACLAGIESRLRRLGASHGPWREGALRRSEAAPRVA